MTRRGIITPDTFKVLLGYDHTKLSATNSNIKPQEVVLQGDEDTPVITKNNNTSTHKINFSLVYVHPSKAAESGTLFTVTFKATTDISEKLDFTFAVDQLYMNSTGVNKPSDATAPAGISVAEALTGSLPVAIDKPVKGEVPQSTIAAATQYTGTIAWEGSPSTFAASTAYTAKVTLTANTGYQFASDVNPTVTDATISSKSVSSDGSKLEFKATFPKTAEKDPLTGSVSLNSTAWRIGNPMNVGTSGITSAAPLGTLSYQWYRVDTAGAATLISSAADSSYTPSKKDDVGKKIKVVVSAENYSGGLEATSPYYGLRRSEVLGLRWSAIDMEHKTISISHKVIEAEVDGKFVPMGEDVLKTKSSFRTLPLIPAVGIILLEEKEKQEMYRRLFKKSYCRDYLDYICVDQCGKLLRPNYVTEHFSWLIEKYGLRKVRFHDLRHTCASLLLSNGISMKQIQIWLGHSTFSTTADIYAHLDYSAQEASANAMNGMFNRPEKEEQLA